MLTKEECKKALEHIKKLRGSNYGWYYSRFNNSALPFDEDINVVQELMHEHFDNPPLKLKELKPNMWVWDNKDKKYNKIIEINGDEIDFYYITSGVLRYIAKFKPNRFYRKEVQE